MIPTSLTSFAALTLLALMPVVVSGCAGGKEAGNRGPHEPFADLRSQLLDGAAINALVDNRRDDDQKEAFKQGVGIRLDPVSSSVKAIKATREEARFDLSVQAVEAQAFFQNLVKDDPLVSIVVHPQVKGTLSLELKGVTVAEVVDIACEMYHFECRPFGRGVKGRRGYKIFPWQLVTQTYRVDFLPVSRDGWSQTSINSGEFDVSHGASDNPSSATSSSNIRTRYDSDFWTDLEDTLRSILNLDLITTSIKDTVDRMGLQKREIEKKPFNSQYDTVVSAEEDDRVRQESEKKIKAWNIGLDRVKYTSPGTAADVRLELDDQGGNSVEKLGRRRIRKQLKNLMVNRQSGLITVRAYPKDHSNIKEFLGHLRSRSQRQVILEAKILEVTLNDATQLGVDWLSVHRGLGGSGSSALGSEPNEGGTFVDRVSRPVYDSTGDTLIHSETTFQKGMVLSKGAAGTAFSLAIRNHDFISFISLLKQQGQVQILSSPRIATLNNQKAVIKVGQDEVFITGMKQGTVVASSNGLSGNAVALSVPVFEKMFTGISLDVTPQIGDGGQVTLHVHPLITEVSDKVKTFNINNQSQSIPLALSQTRETDSIIRVGNSEVAVIGGLMKKNIKENKDKVPFLGDIPGFGGLFRQESKSSSTSELVILIRPIIVGGDRQWSSDMLQTARRIGEMGGGASHE
ncbi:MAG: pilus (MSHA type) biogenesis protein MshL [Magnetococcales bacterium]|nr:pilus (MSHA type) biogenesis protein MshL [Magnetococcales bacterium]